jgi:hypothetical protein
MESLTCLNSDQRGRDVLPHVCGPFCCAGEGVAFRCHANQNSDLLSLIRSGQSRTP